MPEQIDSTYLNKFNMLQNEDTANKPFISCSFSK